MYKLRTMRDGSDAQRGELMHLPAQEASSGSVDSVITWTGLPAK